MWAMSSVSRPAPAEKGRTRVPQRRADSEATRQRILDVAERLFADAGFHATSIRDIAHHAECQFALIGYHFGAKEALLDQVLARRSDVLNRERLAHLEALRAAHGAAPLALRDLVGGFVGTIMARADSGDEGWRNYTRLIAVVAASAEWKDLAEKHFNAVARQYIAELQRSLPEVSSEDLHRAFFFMVGAMLAVCARTDRIETLSDGRFDSRSIAPMTETLCAFLEGGFAAVASRPAR